MPLPPIKIADAVQKAAYDDLAKGSMKQFGDAVAVMVGHVLNPQRKSAEELALDWRTGEEASENRRRLAAEALDRVPLERRIFPAPQIAGPIFRDSEFELPETPIWSMWSELLSRACDRDRANEAHPSYPMLIKSLSSDEAYFLNLLFQRGDRGAFGWRTEYKRLEAVDLTDSEDTELFENFSYPGSFSFYARRLRHLDLIQQPHAGPQEQIGSSTLDMHYRVREVWKLTWIGESFMKAVTPPLPIQPA